LLVFVLPAVAFEILSDFKERRRKPEAYSLDQIAGWVPLDKREGSVKDKDVLGSAEAPLFRQRG
jgi:hypothetical protein